MKTLRSHVYGEWFEPSDGFAPLHDPSTEEPIARTSTRGIDFQKALDFARTEGRKTLSAMTFTGRAAVLDGMYRALYEAREPLIDASVRNTGTTRKDAKFDVDGATSVLKYYATLGTGLGDRPCLVDGEGSKLGRSARFWGQHIRVPLEGAAVLINAFNFPLWGFAEKAAAAILAGMPVIVKPATSTALVTEAGFEVMVNAGAVPRGTASLITGSAGDLLSRLGSQDVVAFTGSSTTAQVLRSHENLLARNTRINVEADSLNAAILAPDVAPGSETWKLFMMDVLREITQKTGQKCTAVRRILVPAERADAVQEELAERLSEVVTGNPLDSSVTMGPICSADQLADAIRGVKELAAEARIVHGTGERIDGVGADPGKGYFLAPVLLRAEPAGGRAVHDREVFGPVATLIPFSGEAGEAASLVARGGGSLVTSLYSDDDGYAAAYLAAGGSHSGRLYLGSEKMAEQAFGSGVALPQSLHGGPGRAGFGEELGGLRALDLYTQRVALQGGHRMIHTLIGETPGGHRED